MALTQNKRAYAAGHFALELGGSHTAGWLYSVEGGMAQAEVISEKLGTDEYTHKHLSAVKYDDITITCGAAMSRNFHKWVKQSFSRDYERKHGAIIAADYNYRELTRLSFFDSLITELAFPALDAAAREPARLTVKLSPEYTRLDPPSGASLAGAFPIDPTKGKHWLTRNFRVQIDGLDCSRVSKVEAITIKQKVNEVPLGEFRDPLREPATLEYSNVVLTMPESHCADFFKWYKTFVIDGKCSDKEEKGGSIEFLHEDMRTIAASIDLHQLGLFKVTPDKGEAGSDKIRNVKLEMYCEQMEFKLQETYY